MVRGWTPAAAAATKRANGFSPNSLALSALINSNAAAPSFRPEELPAVTEPSLRKAARKGAREYRLVSRRGRSRVVTRRGSPLRCGAGGGALASANLPEFVAAVV